MNFYFLKRSSFPAKVSLKVESLMFDFFCLFFFILFIYILDGKSIQLTPLVKQHQQEKLLKDADDLTRQNLFG